MAASWAADRPTATGSWTLAPSQPEQSRHRPAPPSPGPDPVSAPVVQRIFAEYLTGRGLHAIAEGLTRDHILSPSASDPGRHRHRSRIAWSKSAIRAILANPRYTGHQVWNRQRRDEVLVDVALGHTRQSCAGILTTTGSGHPPRPISP
jgi:Recombinase